MVFHKCLSISEGLTNETFQRYSAKKKGKGKEEDSTPSEEGATSESKDPVKIYLHFKRYVYDPNKKMVQSF